MLAPIRRFLKIALGSGGFSKPVKIEPGPTEPEGQLYNLSDDPAESSNRYLEEPYRPHSVVGHQ